MRRSRVLGSIFDVDPGAWDALEADSPFVRHGWLAALEASGTTSAGGWAPAHVVVEEGGVLVGAAPLYLRDESEGEFVWDGPIRSACGRTGLGYAPRAVATVPWTPAGGRRLLTPPGQRREQLAAVAAALVRVVRERGWQSINVHFCAQDELEQLRAVGFLTRLGWQYHWRNRDYEDFEGFLAELKPRRRARIRREMRELDTQELTVSFEPSTPARFELMAELYADTWARHTMGPPALAAEFFTELGQRCGDLVRFGVASRAGQTVAMTLNVVDRGAMFGRWWGCREPLKFLHFNVAYHCAVGHCIEEGLGRFEPGHGGDYKRVRGFEPVFVHSAHWHRDRGMHQAIEAWAEQEARWVRDRLAAKREASPFREAIGRPG